MPLDATLLELLRCPVTGQRLREVEQGLFLETEDGQLRYPIVDGIALLTPADGVRMAG